MAYGVIAVIGKVKRTPAYEGGPSHFYNPLFANTYARGPLKDLEADAGSQDVWYLTEDSAGPSGHSDFLSEDQLRRQTFRTSSPVTVRMLLPPTFEDKGKG